MFTILILLMMLAGVAFFALDKLMVYKRATNIARSGVVYTQREEEGNALRRDLDEREHTSEMHLIEEEKEE